MPAASSLNCVFCRGTYQTILYSLHALPCVAEKRFSFSSLLSASLHPLPETWVVEEGPSRMVCFFVHDMVGDPRVGLRNVSAEKDHPQI